MNIFNVTESNWGYRFLAKSPMDEHHFASSADMGVGLARNLTDLIRWHLTLTKGGSYKHAEEDKYKKLAGQIVYGSKALSTKPGFNVGVVISIEPYQQESESSTEMTSVVALFGAFATKSLRIGGEGGDLSSIGIRRRFLRNGYINTAMTGRPAPIDYIFVESMTGLYKGV